MKNIILLILISLLFTSCKTDIERARNNYKRYFNETLKDPNSLVIYHEEATFDYYKDQYTFKVDYGAKNGYGAMTRSEITITASTKANSQHVVADGKIYIFNY